MSVAARLAIVALRPVAQGACREVGVEPGDAAVAPVADLLLQRFNEHHEGLISALKSAMELAWKTIEIALQGAAWWRGLTAPDDRPLAERLKPFIKFSELDAAKRETIRRLALAELREARKKGLLDLGPAPAEGLAKMSAIYAKFADPDVLLKADRSAILQMADELKKAGLKNLGEWIVPGEGESLLAESCRFFLERAMWQDADLSEALNFADFEPLPADMAQALAALNSTLDADSRRIEELLGNVAAATPEPRVPALDLRVEQPKFADAHARLYQSVGDLHHRLGLSHARVRAGDANSVRNEQERQAVNRLAVQVRELPEDLRRQMPALQNAIGQLQVAAGEFGPAIESFQAAADVSADPAARGESQINAFRAALEQPDYAAALKFYFEAVRIDGKRFATFPVGKFVPIRVMGSGGFGVAFLCKHKYLNSNVVMKTLATDHLERDVDDVFQEAQALAAINHPAIIKVQDCGYVDSGKKQRAFLVMDHFDGVTLEEYVKLKGPLSSEEFLALTEPVVAGLQAAHAKSILHRDIKPANLLVKRLKDASGKPHWEVKLIDFGLALKQAERHSASHASKTGGSAGTTEYAAPEQLGKIEGAVVGPQADIYAFAKTACFALFGTTSPLLKHWKSIPQPLAELLERCLNERPDERPKDFEVVSRCFTRLAQAEANIPVVNSIKPSEHAAIREGQPVYEAAAEPDYYEVAPNSGRRKVLWVLLILFGTLSLFCCGGGGIGLYYGYTELTDWVNGLSGQPTDDGNAVASNDGNDNAEANSGGNPANGEIGGRTAPVNFGQANQTRTVKSTVTIANVPSQLVADFVIARIRGEADNRDAFRAKAKIKSGPTYAGDKVTVDFEAAEGKLAEFLRNVDLGVAENAGDNFTINLTPPPKPSRKPLEWNNVEGLELPRAKLAEIIQDLQKSDWAPFSYRPLINAKPTPQVRNTIRALLRKHAVKQDDAIEALGVWGTAEDVDFILSSGRDPGRIIRAIELLRAQAGIPFLVQQLGNFFNHSAAEAVLRKFGPIIEKDLLTALSSREADAKVHAAELLKEFGSTAALPALKAAAQDRDERVAKAVMDAWKAIAFFPAEPAKSPSTPVAAKPSPPKTIDGAKVTGIDINAAGMSPNMKLTTDGKGFYVLTPDEVRRYDWDGKIAATNRTPAMKLLAVGQEGVLVANSLDAKLLDPVTLTNKNSGPLNNPRWLSIAQNLLVVRSDALGFIVTVDMATFQARNNYLDVKVKGVPAAMVLPSSTGKANPVLTPDAKLLFTRGNGRIYRWRMNDYRIDRAAESGPEIAGADGGELVMSPDGKYVAWLHPTGNKADASFDIKPEPGAATFVFDVNNFRRPAAALIHGPKPACLAFGSLGQAFVGTSGNHLLQFGTIRSGAELKPVKDFNLDEYGKIRQIIVHPDGDKLVVLADKDLLRVDLPKN